MKQAYTQYGDVLTFQFRVPGFSQEQINHFVGEVLVQAEASEDHPEAFVLEAEDHGSGNFDVTHCCDDECRKSGCDFTDEDDEELDAEAEYGRDTEMDYDPDEDRTP